MNSNSEKNPIFRDDIDKDMSENVVENKVSTKKNNKGTQNCKIISYDNKKKILHIVFDNFGIQIPNVDARPEKNIIAVEYQGKIGSKDFSFRLK